MKLETGRLILREWDWGDVGDLIEGLGDLRVSSWLAFVPHPYAEKEAKAWIGLCLRNARSPRNRRSYDFAIALKSERKVIGGVRLHRIDAARGTAGGGIWLNARYQAKGYGREALGEKIRFAFEELGLRLLEDGFFKGNRAARKLQKRFGYETAGLKKNAFRCLADGKLTDEWRTALHRAAWRNPCAGPRAGGGEPLEVRPAFVVKAEDADPTASTLAFRSAKTMHGGKSFAAGDRIYIFASENEGGSGLVAGGIVTSAETVAKRRGVARQTPRVSIALRRTGVARRPLGRTELRSFRDGKDGRPETELNFKFYRQATNKIAGISGEAAAFLDTFLHCTEAGRIRRPGSPNP